MSKLLVLINLLVIFLDVFAQPIGNDLISVVVLHRHGDRAPVKAYKNDPYADESYWPLGFGELTNIGKKQQYGLGKWLRERYVDFLPVSYNKNDIKIHSSNVDRCLMSAESNVAGLYPPEGNQVWNDQLKWQPIPIHTTPKTEDAILAQSKPCSKYSKLLKELMEEEPFNSTLDKYKEQMDYFSKNSGENITTLVDLMDLYNTVYIENLHNLTQPDWTQSLLTEEIEQLSGLAWSAYAYTQDLARLRSGPLIDLILNHFENVKNNVEDTPKFLMLSGHDSTIAPLLTAMQVYDNKWPYYASSVIFELREGKNNDFVNVFYRNPTEIANITLPSCDFDCDFDNFQKVLAPVRTSLEDWNKECQQE
uniref:acid phosphatase n=1 Tax=Anoplophora glabripennis TaxID=217634 RepID=V5I8Q3_ANOGL